MPESYFDLRQRGLKMILNTLRKIDDYNLSHKDAKTLDKEKAVLAIMMEFSVSKQTALKWLNECLEMNSANHEHMLDLENAIKKDNEIKGV